MQANIWQADTGKDCCAMLMFPHPSWNFSKMPALSRTIRAIPPDRTKLTIVGAAIVKVAMMAERHSAVVAMCRRQILKAMLNMATCVRQGSLKKPTVVTSLE
mmetsp:Transcript_44951/g.124568  ORF Transcript_44951/g.124568 Transcript_44951/m.124568 type:complete len:102 (+) Transcript_44951:664-969(+)